MIKQCINSERYPGRQEKGSTKVLVFHTQRGNAYTIYTRQNKETPPFNLPVTNLKALGDCRESQHPTKTPQLLPQHSSLVH